jgi:nitroreductase
VVEIGESKNEMLEVFQAGLEREKNDSLLPEIAIGYADDSPDPRPRKRTDEAVEWRT